MTGLRPIDECQNFFNQNSEFDSILRLLFLNTQYFLREQILEDLKRNLEKWKNEREDVPLYLTLPPGKIGSEYYFYYTLRDFLPKHSLIIDSIPEVIEEGAEILYLDDWVLTGTHAKANFSRISLIEEYDEYYPRYNVNFKQTIIVSIFSNFPQLPDFTIYYTHLVEPFVDILNREIGYDLRKSSSDDVNLRFFQRFCDENKFYQDELSSNYELAAPIFTACPVHLDYKIANMRGSFPLIYKNCRFLAPSKEFMKDTIEFFDPN